MLFVNQVMLQSKFYRLGFKFVIPQGSVNLFEVLLFMYAAKSISTQRQMYTLTHRLSLNTQASLLTQRIAGFQGHCHQGCVQKQ